MYHPNHHRMSPQELVAARLQCHHAAQVIVSLGISLLPAQPDDSHTSLGWDPASRSLRTRPLPGRVVCQGSLTPGSLELAVVGEGVESRFPLDGRTLPEAMAWLRDAARQAGLDGSITDAKHYTIPDHPVASGEPFHLEPPGAFQGLAAWYDLAARALRQLAARQDAASEVRCWPHHFDIATLITVPGPPGEPRSVGAGMSPGDEHYDTPYFYVTPYPYPPADRLPPLQTGRWHTAGWTGAVIGAHQLGADRLAEARVARFLDDAVSAAVRALGPGGGRA